MTNYVFMPTVRAVVTAQRQDYWINVLCTYQCFAPPPCGDCEKYEGIDFSEWTLAYCEAKFYISTYPYLPPPKKARLERHVAIHTLVDKQPITKGVLHKSFVSQTLTKLSSKSKSSFILVSETPYLLAYPGNVLFACMGGGVKTLIDAIMDTGV